MFRNCEKCDFNCNCEVKDADHCPFEDLKVYFGEPVQPRESMFWRTGTAKSLDDEKEDK